jgi:hypothetical protein
LRYEDGLDILIAIVFQSKLDTIIDFKFLLKSHIGLTDTHINNIMALPNQNINPL